MKPNPLDSLFLFFGAAGCLGLLSGCLLVALCLHTAHRPQPGAAVTDSWDNAASPDGFLSGWLVRLILVLLGGSLLAITCFRWAGLALARLCAPTACVSAKVDASELRTASLFPWD